MKKAGLSLFLLVLLSQLEVVAQDTDYRIMVLEEGGKLWGYASLDGELVIEHKYIEAYNFCQEGVTIARKEGADAFEFIDANGNLLPGFKEKVYLVRQLFNFGGEHKTFFGGIMLVSMDELMKLKAGMSTGGQLVTHTNFTWLSQFDEGMAVGKILGDDKKESFVIVIPNEEDRPINSSGVIAAKTPSEGLAPVRLNNDKWGFVNRDGEFEIPARFYAVGNFIGGLAWAKNKDGLIGFIDKEGQWVISPKFKKAKNYDPESGLAMVTVKKGWAYVNREGEIRAAAPKVKLYPYSEGRAISRDKETKKVGCIDKDGEWVIEARFDAIRSFKNGYAVAKLGPLWGLIDKEGDWVFEPKFGNMMDAYPLYSD